MFGPTGRLVDVGKILTGYLFDNLDGVEVWPETPQGADWAADGPSFVVASATVTPIPGSLVLQVADLVVEAYAPDRDTAFPLIADVDELLKSMTGVRGGIQFYGGELKAVTYRPYPGPFYPRYVAAGTLTCRLAGT